MNSPLLRQSAAVLRGSVVMLLLSQASLPAYADGARDREDDQERVRRALEQGEVRPLTDILRLVESRIDGEIVATEFTREDGIWVYEIKFITKSGRMMEIYVNALNGKTVKVEDD